MPQMRRLDPVDWAEVGELKNFTQKKALYREGQGARKARGLSGGDWSQSKSDNCGVSRHFLTVDALQYRD